MKHIENVEWRNGWATFRVNIDGDDRWVAMHLREEDADIVAEIAAKWRQVVRIERLRRRCEAAGMPGPSAADEALLRKLGLLRQRTDVATIGEIEDALIADAVGRKITDKAVRAYLSYLRRIVRVVLKLSSDVEVRRQRASVLTAQLLHDYQATSIAEAKPRGPIAIDKAETTSFSAINQAQAVFSVEALACAHMRALKLPDLTEFTAFKPKGTTRKMRVRVDDETIDRLARQSDALWFSEPGRWLAVALCGGLGLRRSEAVKARWDSVRREGGEWVIYIVTTADGAPKGNEHKKTIDAGLWKDMCAVRVEGSDYIIPGDNADERDSVCQQNVPWLRELGLNVNKPNHELRAIYLQALNRQHGREASQLGGGHSDKRTNEIYTGRDTAPAVRVL